MKLYFLKLIILIAILSIKNTSIAFPSAPADNILLPLEEINPISKLGKIIVIAPQLNLADFKEFSVSIYPKTGNILRQIDLDKSYQFEEQQICLGIASDRGLLTTPVTDKFCGFKIVRGQTLTIELGNFQLRADDTFSVDVGPLVQFNTLFKPNESDIETKIQMTTNIMERLNFSEKYIAPLGNVRFTFGPIGSKSLTDKVFKLHSSNQMFDITPPDLREKIVINISESAKFALRNDQLSTAANLAWVSFRGLNSSEFFNYKWQDLAQQVSGATDIKKGTWLSSPINIGKEHFIELFVFPPDLNHIYTLDMNGYSTPLELNKKLEIVPINVHDFDNDKNEGYFNMYRRSQNPANFIPIYGYNFSEGIYYPGSLNLLSTKTTIMVPKGYAYKIETFIKDDSGTLTPQSIHNLDLIETH